MHFRLRTLLIVLTLGPLVLALAWWKYDAWKEAERRRNAPQQVWLEYVHTTYSDDLTEFFPSDKPIPLDR